jgi:hypothetical protein
MERLKKISKFIYLLALLPGLASAESLILDPTSPSPMTSPDDILALIDRLQIIVNSVAGMLAFLVIAWGAFTLATAGGSTEKAAQGKKILLYGLGGAIFIVLAYAIVKMIIIALGGQVF